MEISRGQNPPSPNCIFEGPGGDVSSVREPDSRHVVYSPAPHPSKAEGLANLCPEGPKPGVSDSDPLQVDNWVIWKPSH